MAKRSAVGLAIDAIRAPLADGRLSAGSPRGSEQAPTTTPDVSRGKVRAAIGRRVGTGEFTRHLHARPSSGCRRFGPKSAPGSTSMFRLAPRPFDELLGNVAL